MWIDTSSIEFRQARAAAVAIGVICLVFGANAYREYQRSLDVIVAEEMDIAEVLTITRFPWDGQDISGTEEPWVAKVRLSNGEEVDLMFGYMPQIGERICIKVYIRESGEILRRPGKYLLNSNESENDCAV